MYKPLHLVPAGTRINFMRPHKIAFIISVIMVVGSFALVFTKGLNFGIDFAGGVIMEVKQLDAGGRSRHHAQRARRPRARRDRAAGPSARPTSCSIRIPQQEGGEVATQAAVAKVKEALAATGNTAARNRSAPRSATELKSSAVWASLFAMLGIMAYIWFRYEWQFGVNAVMALFHDCVTTVGFFALTGLEFNLTTVAAVLTIAGYSVNDTVVIYDRIRYDLRRYKTMPLSQLINQALNETLARTTVTSGLTLLSVVALAVWGGEAMRGFSIAMIWGILIGTYSTICVASPMLLYMNLRNIGSDKGKTAGRDVQKA